MKLILNLVVSALLFMLLAYVIPGVTVDGFLGALIASLVLGFVVAFVGPILKVLTLPINVLTLGLFTFVISALLVMLTAAIVPGFAVDGFWPALIFALVLSIVSGLFGLKKD